MALCDDGDEGDHHHHQLDPVTLKGIKEERKGRNGNKEKEVWD